MHIFYTPYLTLPAFALDEQESKHAVKVLRLQTGQQVQLIDGKGGLYLAEITHTHPKHCELKVIRTLEVPVQRNYHLHLAVAPTKNMDRFEFFVEKATEIGIDEITPLLCYHSERKILKQERLEKVAIAAAKQSVKPFLPQINEMKKVEELLSAEGPEQKFIAHCAEDPGKIPLKKAYKAGKNALILIGPEGDFSMEEITLARTKGFVPVTLGNSRLRTETAAMVACHTVNFMNE